MPQAAFRSSKADEWEWILADDFSAERLATYPVGSQIRAAGGSNEELLQVVATLEKLGYPFASKDVVDVPTGAEDGNFHVRVEGVIDEQLLRAIAKVAFNYFAYTNPEIVLRTEFDPIRAFIRHGVAPGWAVVEVREEPILQNERTGERVTDGHILTVGWGPGGALPIGKIAFFNAITYVVNFCEALASPLPLKISGHHLHPTFHTIQTLDMAPRRPGGA